MLTRFVLLAVGVLALSGCEAGFSGKPASSIDPERDFNAIIINGTLNKERLAVLAQQPFVDRNTRNAIIEARMAEIDVLYNEYETNITAEIRRTNFGTSLAGIVVGAVGAQASGGAARNYAALGGVLSGASAAYQKEVLLDQSIQAFISQMRASRNAQKQRILSKLNLPGTAYSLQAALSDLSAYEQAGTLASAVSGLTEKAQTAERSSAAELQTTERRVLNARVNRAPAPQSRTVFNIGRWINAPADQDGKAARNRQANECFDTAEVDNKPDSFVGYVLNADDFEPLGDAIKACLNTRFGAGI